MNEGAKVESRVDNDIPCAVTRLPFYNVMRWLERQTLNMKTGVTIGRARKTKEEGFLLGGHASLVFQGNEVQSLFKDDAGKYRLLVNVLPLLGPQGPLPFYLAEALSRAQREKKGDVFSAFLSIFHHRLLCLYYRIWAQTQPTVQRGLTCGQTRWLGRDRFAQILASLSGTVLDGLEALTVNHPLRLTPSHVVSRDFEGLCTEIWGRLRVKVRIAWPDCSKRYAVGEAQRTRLCGKAMNIRQERGQFNATLGSKSHSGTAWIGACLYSRDYAVTVVLENVTVSKYQTLLPGKTLGKWLAEACDRAIPAVVDWTLAFEVSADEGIQCQLGSGQGLGRNAWLVQKRCVPEVLRPVVIPDYMYRRQGERPV